MVAAVRGAWGIMERKAEVADGVDIMAEVMVEVGGTIKLITHYWNRQPRCVPGLFYDT